MDVLAENRETHWILSTHDDIDNHVDAIERLFRSSNPRVRCYWKRLGFIKDGYVDAVVLVNCKVHPKAAQ